MEFDKQLFWYGGIIMDKEFLKKLEETSEKEEKECLMEDISEEEAKRIFDKYSSMYDEALRRLS